MKGLIGGFASRQMLQTNATNALPTIDVTIGGTLDTTLTSIWLLITGFLVFFMQCGFALLEAGGIRFKNTRNILLKNVINTCICVLAWWAVGQAVAYSACGAGNNPFIGTNNFMSRDQAVVGQPLYWSQWFFGFVFAAVSVTIPSGALAERCQFRAYMIYSLFHTVWTYPVIVHWVWSKSGWLSPFRINCLTGLKDVLFSRTVGFIDFAGSGNVHMTGGAAALAGAFILGPRIGRFTSTGHVATFAPNNPIHMALGTFILWLGWYGFNPGSTGCAYNCMYLAARVAVNTTLAAAAGGASALLFEAMLGRPTDIAAMLNGILAGLVAITSPCAVVEDYGAVIVGIGAGATYLAGSSLMKRMRIDDPLDSSAVHFFAGCWGILSIGFLATKPFVEMTYGSAQDYGVFYGGSGWQLAVQVLGLTSIATFALCSSGALWLTLKYFGWLRVSKEVEEEGLDHAQGIGTGMVACFPCFG